MKNIVNYSIVFITCFLFSGCKTKTFGQALINPQDIFKDFDNYWEYHTNYVELNRDFVAMDSNQNILSKNSFFESIINKDLFPLRLKSKESNSYQLYKVPDNTIADIRRVIKQMALEDYDNFRQEGIAFPTYDFVDLNGTHYNNENTRGKIIVLKCGYIGCVACLAEFPKCNNLFKKYQTDSNIVFLNLEFDDKRELTNFLLKHPLSWNTVPNQKTLLREVLKIGIYPTDIIIRDGIIIKRVGSVEDVDLELQKQTSKRSN